MRFHLLSVAAATLPLTSALVIGDFQDILRDIESLEDEIFHPNPQNPLDHAIERSPTFTPAEPLDTSDPTTIPDLTTSTLNAWTKAIYSNPFDEILNAPSEPINADVDLDNLHPHHPPTSDKTIYQLISESKYTTVLKNWIETDKELVDFLNSTEHHKITIFAPTDAAFEKIPHHRHRDHDHDHDHDHDGESTLDIPWQDQNTTPSVPKEVVRLLARYHASPFELNAAKLFHSHTIPSALHDPFLGGSSDGDEGEEYGEHKGLLQRIAVRAGFKGLTLNFYSHIVAADIGASNGIIHAVDNILLPPPSSLFLLEILPTKFSTFTLGLTKTSLDSTINTTSTSSGTGFTIFAPSNSAFQKLGLKINAFLFSPPGLKYLKALLKYHIVPDEVLYSDVLYKDGEVKPFGLHHGIVRKRNPETGIDGFAHLDLPTLLGGEHKIAVDVAHYGPYVSFKVNGGQRVGFADVVGKDGVIHVLDRVLIPPRRLGGFVVEEDNEEMELEELVERLEPFVEENGDFGIENIMKDL
ncbi:fasciclin domain-containing protein [Aspergillus stella-maris]|uniref:fasciclin domain-containing protein n=1 Tax=Aspergillus stella-maris TaxID=1810926 RepID=UPI003CCD5757